VGEITCLISPHWLLPQIPPCIGGQGSAVTVICERPQRGSGQIPDRPKVLHYFHTAKLTRVVMLQLGHPVAFRFEQQYIGYATSRLHQKVATIRIRFTVLTVPIKHFKAFLITNGERWCVIVKHLIGL